VIEEKFTELDSKFERIVKQIQEKKDNSSHSIQKLEGTYSVREFLNREVTQKLINKTTLNMNAVEIDNLRYAQVEINKVRQDEAELKKDMDNINKISNDLSVESYSKKLNLINNIEGYMNIEHEQNPAYSPLLLLKSPHKKNILVSHSFKKNPEDDSKIFEHFRCQTILVKIELLNGNSAFLSTVGSGVSPTYVLINCIDPDPMKSKLFILKRGSCQSIDISQYSTILESQESIKLDFT